MNIIYMLLCLNFILFLFNIYLIYKNKNNILNYINNTLLTYLENNKSFLELKGKLLDITENMIQQKTDIESDIEKYIENKLFSIDNDIKVINKKINSDKFNNLLYTDNLKQQIIDSILNDDLVKQNIVTSIKTYYIDTYFETYNSAVVSLYKEILDKIKDNNINKPIFTDLNADNIDSEKMQQNNEIFLEPEKEEQVQIEQDPLIDKHYNDIINNMKINKPAITQGSEGLNMNFKSKNEI